MQSSERSSLSPLTADELLVVLNPRARGVTPRMVHRLRSCLDPRIQVALPETREASEEVVRAGLRAGRRAILTGGGDGTLMAIAAVILGVPGAAGRALLCPLRLGTGSGTARMLGAQPDPVVDIHQLLQGPPRTLLWRLLEVRYQGGDHPQGGRCAAASWAGVGYDSQVLEDYRRVCRVAPAMDGLPAYLAAGLGLTPPRILFGRRPHARVISLGGSMLTARVEDGMTRRFVRPAGAVIAEGPTGLAGGACFGHFGFRFMAFPLWHRLPDHFSFRFLGPSVGRLLSRLPAVWRGREANEGDPAHDPLIRDFLFEKVAVEFDRPEPFQINGDGIGLIERYELGLGAPVRLVDWRRPGVPRAPEAYW